MRFFQHHRILRSSIATVLALCAALSAAGPAHAEVKVGLSDWPGWVAWYVADQKGFFKRHGANVKLVWFGNYTDSVAALSAGQLDANAQTWSDTMTPLAKKVDVKAVLVNDNSAGNDALMVGPKIKSFADLKGRTVALEQFSISHFVLATALARNGMSMNDVKVVNLSAGDAAAAFVAGRVDAAVVWNPWVNKIQASGKGHALFTSRDMPGLVPDLLVAHGRLGVRLGEPVADARASLERIVADVCARDPWLRDHPVDVTWPGGQFASGRIDPEHGLVRDVVDSIEAVEGRSAALGAAPYGSDLRLYAGIGGIPTLHYGPGDVTLAHAPAEKVGIAEVQRSARSLALVAARRCGAHL